MRVDLSSAIASVGSWISGGSSNVFVALIAGAGGSALMEMFWKPRRERRRAAALLATEISMNAEELRIHAHFRTLKPWTLPADFEMSTVVLDTSSQVVAELPIPVMRDVLTIYERYRALNKLARNLVATLETIETCERDSEHLRELHDKLLNLMDVFTETIAKAIVNGEKLLPTLRMLAHSVDSTGDAKNEAEEKARAEARLKEREDNLESLREARRKALEEESASLGVSREQPQKRVPE